MDLAGRLPVLALLLAEGVIFVLIVKDWFAILLAKGSSDEDKRPKYKICPEANEDEFQGKVDKLLDEGKGFRIFFFFVGIATMVVNTNAVVTNALTPPVEVRSGSRWGWVDARWGWIELLAFLYSISGFNDVRNTASRLEHVVLWTQHAKAFSLMRYVKFFSPGVLFQKYKHALVLRTAEGRWFPAMHALWPVIFCELSALLGLVSMTMKIRQVGFCLQREPWEWKRVEVMLFIAFCNNIVGITDHTVLKMDQILILLFGGVDAEIVAEERGTATAVYDRIFHSIRNSEQLSRFDKLVITFTFGAQDLQRLLVEEDTAEEASPSSSWKFQDAVHHVKKRVMRRDSGV